jgi:hypothetical protein
MTPFPVRKVTSILEEIRHEGGPPPERPRLRGAVLAVVKNPYAGRYVEDVQAGMEALKPLGLEMTDRLFTLLGGADAGIDGYGKGAIVGSAGELEHGAMWHVPGGYAMRDRLGEALAIVPSSKKVGGMGARIDIPIGHINAAYVRSHFDAITVAGPDAPRAGEIVFVLAMSRGGRVHSRMGGLEAADAKGLDGLR